MSKKDIMIQSQQYLGSFRPEISYHIYRGNKEITNIPFFEDSNSIDSNSIDVTCNDPKSSINKLEFKMPKEGKDNKSVFKKVISTATEFYNAEVATRDLVASAYISSAFIDLRSLRREITNLANDFSPGLNSRLEGSSKINFNPLKPNSNNRSTDFRASISAANVSELAKEVDKCRAIMSTKDVVEIALKKLLSNMNAQDSGKRHHLSTIQLLTEGVVSYIDYALEVNSNESKSSLKIGTANETLLNSFRERISEASKNMQNAIDLFNGKDLAAERKK